MVLLGRFGGGKEIVGSGRRKKHAPAAAAHHAEAGKTGTRRQASRCVGRRNSSASQADDSHRRAQGFWADVAWPPGCASASPGAFVTLDK